MVSQHALRQGVSAPRGVSAPGGVVSQHALRQTPPCKQNDKQVQKYYLGHNFVAAGKKSQSFNEPLAFGEINKLKSF